MKKLTKHFKNKFVLFGVGAVVIILLIFMFTRGGNGGDSEVFVVKKGGVTESVNLTGKVSPFQKADLGFEKGGVISKINVKVGDEVKAGDLLASLDNSDTYASLQGAQASLRVEQIKLAELERGLRPEEVDVEESKLTVAKSNYEDARTGLLNGYHDSYVKTSAALTNYADTFFDYPQSANPQINVSVGNQEVEREISAMRRVVTEDMKKWKIYLDSITTTTNPTEALNDIHRYLFDTKNFLSRLSSIITELGSGTSGYTEDEIDGFESTINSAMSSFNTAVAALTTAEASFKDNASALSLAQNEYSLQKSGSSAEEIQTQQAKVAQAAANVATYQAEIGKKIIVSPLNGVVSRVDPQLGEFVSAGEIVFGVIADHSFKIEINVPEVDIVKIGVGNTASITLDAYDESVIFTGKVVSIDPAETLVEGIPTYKVTLQFDTDDDRVRSGMTANADIITNSKQDVVVVPTRAIFTKLGKKYIRIIPTNGEDYVEVPITTGVRGSDGMTEILSGVNVGDKVITLVK